MHTLIIVSVYNVFQFPCMTCYDTFVIPCYALLWYVMLCCVMTCYIVLCIFCIRVRVYMCMCVWVHACVHAYKCKCTCMHGWMGGCIDRQIGR